MPTLKTIPVYGYSTVTCDADKTSTLPEYTSSFGDSGSLLLKRKRDSAQDHSRGNPFCGTVTTKLAPSFVSKVAPSLCSINSSMHEQPMQPNTCTTSKTDAERTNEIHNLQTPCDELQMHYDVMVSEASYIRHSCAG